MHTLGKPKTCLSVNAFSAISWSWKDWRGFFFRIFFVKSQKRTRQKQKFINHLFQDVSPYKTTDHRFTLLLFILREIESIIAYLSVQCYKLCLDLENEFWWPSLTWKNKFKGKDVWTHNFSSSALTFDSPKLYSFWKENKWSNDQIEKKILQGIFPVRISFSI